MGIDINNDFEPHYITIRGKGKTLAELKKAASKSSEVLLATDPDREGEAISWHLERALHAANENISRIEFNEITQEAVRNAVKSPRRIDLNRVQSQQARRLLDRLVGYSISPILQEKFGSRQFSAGRVQSAALRILCARENEVDKFQPEEFWEFDSYWDDNSGKTAALELPLKLVQINGEKPQINNKEEAELIEKKINSLLYYVKNRNVSERKVNPSAPYITSRLQQDASTRLGFRAQKTMSVAQSLYEGVEIGHGQVTGLITYMRTDSTRISETGLQMARDYIQSHFSPDYLPEKAINYARDKAAQDAHEAIRPTDVTRTPQSIAQYLSRDQMKLYSLIWQRFVGSQMTPGVDENVRIDVASKNSDEEFIFRFTVSRMKFTGFREVFPSAEKKKSFVPAWTEGIDLKLLKLDKQRKFTQAPPRYTEASLIRVMEESGIGRPATYVPTIATLDKRAYIERNGRQLRPTQLGRVVNGLMENHFPDIVNLEFTASMEEKLDKIAQGDQDWKGMLRDFFSPFQSVIEKASSTMENQSHLIRIPLGRECPKCSNELMKKLGKNGYFIGCSNFSGGCRYTESIPLGICPLCQGNVVRKKSKKGRNFYGCEKFSETGCDFTMLDKPAARPCPKCQSIMGQKVRKSGITLTCQNPSCHIVLEEDAQEN